LSLNVIAVKYFLRDEGKNGSTDVATFMEHRNGIASQGRKEPEALKGKGKTGTLTRYRESGVRISFLRRR